MHAISAAGVAHALTRACSAGELDDCGCDRTVRGASPEGFQWAGCSDNVHFGTSFSRTFVDAREHRFSKRKPKANLNSTAAAQQQQMQIWRALMNLHNNEAGRKVYDSFPRLTFKVNQPNNNKKSKKIKRRREGQESNVSTYRPGDDKE